MFISPADRELITHNTEEMSVVKSDIVQHAEKDRNYEALFQEFGIENFPEEFERVMATVQADADFLLNDLEDSEDFGDFLMKIGEQVVVNVNQGGMGTGTSGYELVKAMLLAGSIGRLSSVGAGRYHKDKDQLTNTKEGIHAMYDQFEPMVEELAQNAGVEDVLVVYKALGVTSPENARKMADNKGYLSAPLHFKIMDLLTLGQDLLELKKIPNDSKRGMLGINVMHKTTAYRESAILAALAFSGDKEGIRSEGLLTLSAGVADDILYILSEVQETIPELQIPRIDFVVSMGAPLKTILSHCEEYGIWPDMITFENPAAGGHLGAKKQMIKKFYIEREEAEEDVVINPRKASSTANAPDVIYALLSQLHEQGLDIPISLAGGYNIDSDEQGRLLNIFKEQAEKIGYKKTPDIGWQLGSQFASAMEADPTVDFKMDIAAAAYDGENPMLAERREANRFEFFVELVSTIEKFEKIQSRVQAELDEKEEVVEGLKQELSKLRAMGYLPLMENPTHTQDMKDLEIAIEEAEEEVAIPKRTNSILKTRIAAGKEALEQLNSGANTIVFLSTAGFFARAVPNHTLAQMIMGTHIQNQECIHCLKDCAYVGRSGTLKNGRVKIVTKPGAETAIMEFELDGEMIRIAPEGFCIEEVLQKDDPDTGVLVFRGDGEVASEPKAVVNVIADNIRNLKLYPLHKALRESLAEKAANQNVVIPPTAIAVN